jgi:Ni/Co efflux regulator RcnB
VRGQYLPPEARGAVIQDYGRFHLRRPPRGYFWFRAGDNYVMASSSSGMIFEVIPADPW